MNIPLKAIDDYALPPGGGTYHCRPILDGYADVEVDEVMPNFEQM
jgi:hypothetical protein